jgi:hypothetical protein
MAISAPRTSKPSHGGCDTLRVEDQLMSDCQLCPVEPECHYPYKPCDCVHQRKFWSAERAADEAFRNMASSGSIPVDDLTLRRLKRKIETR